MSIECMVSHFAQQESPLLRIGVRYGWDSHRAQRGDIVVVRMRVRSGDQQGVARRLAPGDVILQSGDGMRDSSEHDCAEGFHVCTGREYPRGELSGSCCECCHDVPGHGCFGTFPHHSTANQFLTPTLFSNYVRLGYENSKRIDEVLAQIRREQLSSREAEEEDLGAHVRGLSASFRRGSRSTSETGIEASLRDLENLPSDSSRYPMSRTVSQASKGSVGSSASLDQSPRHSARRGAAE